MTVLVEEKAAAKLFFVPRWMRNPQVDRLVEHFGSVEASSMQIPDGLRIVFLCFTQRSGSTYLAQLIASSGDYNVPREYLNFDHVKIRSAKRNIASFQDYFSDLLRTDAKKGRIFIKITPNHLGLLDEAKILDRILGLSDFILIERGDKLAQAISFSIARETGKYTSTMQSRKSEQELVFRRESVTGILNELANAYKQFDLFFGMNGIVPINVMYENLVAAPEAALRTIADRLGVTGFPIRPENIQNARQAGQINAAWRALYLQGEGNAS